MELSLTAQAIKNYKSTFTWINGYESWLKVPTAKDYTWEAPHLGLKAIGDDQIKNIVFKFCIKNKLEQKLVNISEHGRYITCELILKRKTGKKFKKIEVFLVDEKNKVKKIWAL